GRGCAKARVDRRFCGTPIRHVFSLALPPCRLPLGVRKGATAGLLIPPLGTSLALAARHGGTGAAVAIPAVASPADPDDHPAATAVVEAMRVVEGATRQCGGRRRADIRSRSQRARCLSRRRAHGASERLLRGPTRLQV